MQLPMNTDEGLRFMSWPVALPHHMATQLLAAGYREQLGYADDSYWKIMLEKFGVPRPQGPDAIGLQMWGDEGQIFETESWMALQWSSEHFLWYQDARKSRFLICSSLFRNMLSMAK